MPGALPSHYAPATAIRIVTPAQLAARWADGVGLIAPAPIPTPAGVRRIASPRGNREYARGLYAWLRTADELGCSELLLVLATETGEDPMADALAVAIRDRAMRATAVD